MQEDEHLWTHLIVDGGQIDGARVGPRLRDAGTYSCGIGFKDDPDQRY